MTQELLDRLLTVDKETTVQEQIHSCLNAIFQDQDDLTTVVAAGQLIEYTRDVVLVALGVVRRSAAVAARSKMSPAQIADSTGLSRATVSRLITEHRAA